VGIRNDRDGLLDPFHPDLMIPVVAEVEPITKDAIRLQVQADPEKLEDLSGRIATFRLSCCFERLKRAGRFEDVMIDDPFDPESAVNPASTPRDSSRAPHDFSLNYPDGRASAWIGAIHTPPSTPADQAQ